MVPVLVLADDLITKLAAATGYTFTRRTAPYFNRSDVEGGKWIVVAAGDEQAIRGRQVDRSTLTVDVGYQESLPESTDAYPDPLENTPWMDARLGYLEEVKKHFRGEGSLRNAAFDPDGQFIFQSMANSPIYRPDMMVDYQIFTAVIRLQFAGEIDAD